MLFFDYIIDEIQKKKKQLVVNQKNDNVGK